MIVSYSSNICILLLANLALGTHAFIPSKQTNPISFISHNEGKKQTTEFRLHEEKMGNGFMNDDDEIIYSALSSRRGWMKKVTSAAGIAATGTCWGANPAIAADSVAVLEKAKNVAGIDDYLCDASVSTWKNSQNGRIVHLIGTAHISSSSAQLAGNVVREVRPDAVFVELDAKRVARAVPSAEKSPADTSAVKPNNSSPPPPMDTNNNNKDPTDTNASKSTTVTTSSMNAVEGNPQQDRLRKTNPFDIKERVMRAGSAMVGDAIKGLYKKLESDGFSAGEEVRMSSHPTFPIICLETCIFFFFFKW